MVGKAIWVAFWALCCEVIAGRAEKVFKRYAEKVRVMVWEKRTR